MEQLFRSVVEDSNQTIIFCGVVSHHQNDTVEKKIQNIILGARTLLLHAETYLTEVISTMICPYALKVFAE